MDMNGKPAEPPNELWNASGWGNVRSRRNGRILKNRAYFEYYGTNSLVLEVDPTSSAKAVRRVILDGAKTYSEEIYPLLKIQLKDSKHRVKKGEKSGNFSDYMYERKHYEELKRRLADAENGKPVDPISGELFKPNVVVLGFRTEKIFDYSKKHFKELLDELKSDALNEKQKREEKYQTSEEHHSYRLPFGPLAATVRHNKKEYETALRTYNALDYMSKNLNFQQTLDPANSQPPYTIPQERANVLPKAPPASTAKNKANTRSYARKA